MTRPEPDCEGAAWFAQLSQDLMSDLEVIRTQDRICEWALEVVPNADFSAITMRRRRGRLETLAYTHELALQCDALQYGLSEGPCVESALEDESFLVASTGEDRRWPRWGPAVAGLGVHSLISVQLPATAIDPERDPIGAINIYGREIAAFDAGDLERARVFGVHAGNALSMAHQLSTLTDAVEARHLVGVAQGVLMLRYGINLEQTFELLQRYSNHANIKLRDVAALAVEHGELPVDYEDFGTGAPSQG